jgi:hypothetical protein
MTGFAYPEKEPVVTMYDTIDLGIDESLSTGRVH